MTPTELTAARKELGYSTAEMARRLKVSTRVIQMYEDGKRSDRINPARPIPRVVEIAVRGIAAARKIKTAARNQDILETAKEFAAAVDGPFL
jgi:DNA-binding XRE family transcriptional regulator